MVIDRMNIEYDGALYRAAIVQDKEGFIVTIASSKLYDALCPDGISNGFASLEAQLTDRNIFGYLCDADFDGSDEELLYCIREQWSDEDIF